MSEEIWLELDDELSERVVERAENLGYASIEEYIENTLEMDARREKTKKEDQLVTFRLPEEQLEGLDKLVQDGEYESRSEAIRDALLDYRQTDHTKLQRAAISAYNNAQLRGRPDLAEKARRHIMTSYPDLEQYI